MLYCEKCMNIYDDTANICPICKSSENMRTALENDFVFLDCIDDAMANILKFELKSSDISYKIDIPSNGDGKNVYVKYCDFNKANELLIKIKQRVETECWPEEAERMPRWKRTTVRVVSIIAFLLLITAVVLFTDSIILWIMGLFT